MTKRGAQYEISYDIVGLGRKTSHTSFTGDGIDWEAANSLWLKIMDAFAVARRETKDREDAREMSETADGEWHA